MQNGQGSSNGGIYSGSAHEQIETYLSGSSGRKIRIALFTNGIWPYVIGGMQKHSYYLVKYLTRKGIYIDLYHCPKGHPDADSLDCFTEEEKKFITSIVIEFPTYARTPWRYLSESYKFSKLIFDHFSKRPKADFVYTKSYTAWYYLKKKKKDKGLPPIGIRLHGYELFQPPRNWLSMYRKLIYSNLLHYLHRNADCVYSYGKGITDIINKNIPAVAHKIVEVPAGIDPEWLFEKNIKVACPLRFTFLGRYERRKGIEELTEALNKVLERNEQQMTFNFIGPIADSNKIKHPSVNYFGLIKKREEIQNILRETDVFVLPSHSEGMPNVVMEAMASGCAVLATNVGSVGDLVDNNNGWLIPPLSAHLLERKISDILSLSTENIVEKKINSVLKIKSQFLWDRIIEREIAEILKIIDN